MVLDDSGYLNVVDDGGYLKVLGESGYLRFSQLSPKFLTTIAVAIHRIEESLKLIICYISSGATNIAEVSSGFHQADWSNTLVIVYLLSNHFFVLLYLFTFLLVSHTQLDCAHMRRQVNLNLRLYITND